MSVTSRSIIHGDKKHRENYTESVEHGENWTLHLGDCVEKTKEIPDESIHFSVFSPPFASLYTYSDSERDMGNSANTDQFFEHFKYLIHELYRVIMPGRNCSVHRMNLPTSLTKDGVIGIRDFRGEIIRAFADEGWIYHSEVCIWKDPVVAMQRTKALGLLYKQLKKDSCRSRQGIADYLVTFRKPGINEEPVGRKPENFPVSRWQKWASPVWMDIEQGNTLQKERDEKDEKHICPLQLDVIERAVTLWSNSGDTILSPFAGIGSEGYQSILIGRKFVGIELKPGYFQQAVTNLKMADINARQQSHDLFSEGI
ncbi:MAG: site-specific DNA-methyltransferase [FCB group bacterium]|nr:site-specific DNA-methyltransferase [FCB group bacterium]